ncbi:hypothetical protein DPMN_151678 [Dreissena polymorpha]|uniref:Uncharacterized protein n=1 Tax=Dreissena polymorpha TaxID=45954 RepID=A0A9D4FIX7_DREPO|nr:hypothetical protein DPMN_151678 [Dreissena polymorpha]
MMKNAYKLLFSEDDYLKKIGMEHDMNKEEILKDAQLRKEAKTKTDGDEHFQYLVRGPVWDRKMTKVRKGKKTGEGVEKGHLHPG